MRHSILVLHITGGAIGLLTGFLALYASKGAPLHRRVGMAFVVAMLTMTFGALAYMAAGRTGPIINVIAATLTTYLVVTSLVTMRSVSWWNRTADVAALVLVCIVAVAALALGRIAIIQGKLDGIPPFPYLLFAATAILCVIGDVRLLRAKALERTQRLVRHLWRMSFALFIAALSFFLGQADELPRALRIPALLALPPLAVLVTMLYWLWRVRIRRMTFGGVRR